MRYVYADYAATTPVDKRVLKFAKPYFSEKFGNPSSQHKKGIEAKNVLEESRRIVAQFFNCEAEEVVFTSGGTETENLAIKGICFSNHKFGKHVIISAVEHASVDSSVDFLEKQGFEISRIPVDKECIVNVENLKLLIRDDTILISVMYVNNEIGSIQPISKISEIIRQINDERLRGGKHKILFHVDGEAGSIYLDYDVKKLGVDSISVNGSKVYSLKGASALFIKKGTGVATQICGGGQESMIRGGTENIPAIVSLAKALSLAQTEREINVNKVFSLKKKFISGLIKKIPNVRLNTPVNSVSNIIHVTFLSEKKLDLIKDLDGMGICVSSGSACASNKNKISSVLSAMGFSEKDMGTSVRFSFGKDNNSSDIKYIIKKLKKYLANAF